MSVDPAQPLLTPTSGQPFTARWQAALHQRTAHLNPVTRALLWSMSAGLLFCLLNTIARTLTQQLHPMQTQFLRYLFGLLVMLPLVLRAGWRAYRPKHMGGQFLRGLAHTAGLVMWFTALPRIPLADTTAIGFTAPIFIMIGAYLFLGEPMRWERWVASTLGFVGVLVVLWPAFASQGGFMSGSHAGWHLLMLASAPVFAASFLLTKVLTRTESTAVIVLWQALTVTLMSLPLAVPGWAWPNAWQWLAFAVCGLLGSMGHYCLTRSFRHADISATQSVKFLDLVWASALGFLIFADLPASSTLLGGALICAATLWLARRESRTLAQMDPEP